MNIESRNNHKHKLRNSMISVCMTTYKGEKYREAQIESILRNLSKGDELIVSEDGDDMDFLEELKKRDSRIVPLKGPGRGAVANFEYALSHAKGDIIFLSDQDDLWTGDKVEKVLLEFEDKEVTLVIHDADLIDGEGKEIADSFFAFRNSKSGFLKNLWKNSYIGCCMAFRRELLEYALPFPTGGTLHDQWLGMLSEQMGRVTFLEEKLVHYRRHEENVSGMQHLPVMTMLYNRVSLCWNLLCRKIRGAKSYKAYAVDEVKERWKY